MKYIIITNKLTKKLDDTKCESRRKLINAMLKVFRQELQWSKVPDTKNLVNMYKIAERLINEG